MCFAKCRVQMTCIKLSLGVSHILKNISSFFPLIFLWFKGNQQTSLLLFIMKVQCMEFLEVFLFFSLSIFPLSLSLIFSCYFSSIIIFPLFALLCFLFWQCQGISSVKGNWKHSFTCWTGWVSESWAGYSPLPDQNEEHAHTEQFLVLLSSMFGNNHHHHQHLWND